MSSHTAPYVRLKRVKLALSDWIHCHAPDMCETYRVEETHKRIQDFGGTLYYIAKAVEDVEAVMGQVSEKGTKNHREACREEGSADSAKANGPQVASPAASHQPTAEGTPSELVKRVRAYSYLDAANIERLERELAEVRKAQRGLAEDVHAALDRAEKAEAALAAAEDAAACWYTAAHPYATPMALHEGLKALAAAARDEREAIATWHDEQAKDLTKEAESHDSRDWPVTARELRMEARAHRNSVEYIRARAGGKS